MRTIIRDNYDPTPNEYHETIVVDEAREKRWLFDCDGVFHDITKVNVVSERGDSEEYAASQKWVTDEVEALEAADQALQDNIDAEEAARIAADETLQDNIDAEEADRIAADTEIWDEIEAIEAASDVVDIVGTYAELQQYDTSALQDNDIIKVLADETHDDAIAYYRWSTSTESFSFVGVEGPYYTASETDALLATKQDKLTAGTGIDISSNDVISFDDSVLTHGALEFQTGQGTYTFTENSSNQTTTIVIPEYSDFTGATASTSGTDGLVPAPAAGDQDKYLKGDGTWGTVQSGATSTLHLYQASNWTVLFKDAALATRATGQEIIDAFDSGTVIVHDGNFKEYQVISLNTGVAQGKTTVDIFLFNYNAPNVPKFICVYTMDASGTSFNKVELEIQKKLTAGTNITIAGTTISATDTTYNDFTGATASDAGAAGLVPAPAAGEEGYLLCGNGTWVPVTMPTYLAGNGIDINSNNEISVDTAVVATQTDLAGKQDTLTAGAGINIDANNEISVITNNINSTDWNALWQ